MLITGAHTWHALPDRGQHLLSCLYQQMTISHKDRLSDQLALILSGRKDPLHAMLRASPALAARFPAIIDFPGYTPAQLTTIVTTLAADAADPHPRRRTQSRRHPRPRRTSPRHRQRAPGRPPAEPGDHEPGPPPHRCIPPP